MKLVIKNKRVFHDYQILDTMEAGIVLKGDEVKSVRNKNVSLNDAFAVVQRGEIVLINCYIGPYSHAYHPTKDTSRQSRKLLLKKREVNKLIGDISRKGLVLVPLKMYINNRGFIKVELGLAKHKKKVDKKRELRERDIKRETAREIKMRLK